MVQAEKIKITLSKGFYNVSFSNLTPEELRNLLETSSDYSTENILQLDMIVENVIGEEKLKEAYNLSHDAQYLNAVKAFKEGFEVGLKEAKDIIDIIRSNDKGTTLQSNEYDKDIKNHIFTRWSRFTTSQQAILETAFSLETMRKYRGAITGSKFNI